MREQLYAFDPSFLLAYKDRRENLSEPERAHARDLWADPPAPDSDEAIDAIFTAEGDRAVIRIEGPLSMAGPDWLDLYCGYGGVSYATIIGALARAQSGQYREVLALANTPGGEVNGADITYQAMSALASKIPLYARVSGMLASAGYYILCPAKKISATAPTDQIGSIGVVIAGWDFTGAYAEMGIKKWSIVSKNAPNKAAGFDTKAGREILQERADAIERVFYQRIAEARGITPEYIAANFGQGALLIARDPDTTKPDALRAKMIDGLDSEPGEFAIANEGEEEGAETPVPVAAESPKKTKPEISPAVAGASQSQEAIPMATTLSEFLAQNPAAVSEIDQIKKTARAEGHAEQLKISARVGAVMASEAYAKSKVLRAKAEATLKGDMGLEAFEAVVAAADMHAEQLSSDAAAGESEELGDTRGEAPKGEAAEIQALGHLIATAGRPKEGK